MTNISVLDVARYILSKTGAITTMKLQKLVYYAQAWHLVWSESPLYNEKIEAWANGPVVKELYEAHKGQFTVKTLTKGNKDNLSSQQKGHIDKVLKFYGDKSAQWLSDLTHNELPWILARKGLAIDERGGHEITIASMHEYYSGLLDV